MATLITDKVNFRAMKVTRGNIRLPNQGEQQWEEEFLENQTLKASGI